LIISLFPSHDPGGGKIHNNWLECTDEGKAKLEQMFKGKFVFQAIEPPEPTPSMKAKKEETKK